MLEDNDNSTVTDYDKDMDSLEELIRDVNQSPEEKKPKSAFHTKLRKQFNFVTPIVEEKEEESELVMGDLDDLID